MKRSGILYTYIGEDYGDAAGNDVVAGMAACFLAGTICSLVAALITFKIDDQQAGLKCGSCLTIIPAREEAPAEKMDEEEVLETGDAVSLESPSSARGSVSMYGAYY